MLMKDLGLYCFKDEDEMISLTSVDENLYKQAMQVVAGRSNNVKIENNMSPVNEQEAIEKQKALDEREEKLNKELEQLLDEFFYYTIALEDYKKTLWLPFMKSFYFLNSGFCYYFRKKFNIGFTSYHFKILHDLKPDNKLLFWFKEGRLRPRIKLLEEALQITNTQIELKKLQLKIKWL